MASKGALVNTGNALCCQFLTWNTPGLCSSLLFESSQGACHLSHHRITQHTQHVLYMSRETHPESKDVSWNIQWNKHFLREKCANAHQCAQSLSSLGAHSFLLQQHKSYQACCQCENRETNMGREKERNNGTSLVRVWLVDIFLYYVFWDTVCGHCCMFSVYKTVCFVLLL